MIKEMVNDARKSKKRELEERTLEHLDSLPVNDEITTSSYSLIRSMDKRYFQKREF